MGRPKKSIEQHLKDGTYRPDRHGPIPAAGGGGVGEAGGGLIPPKRPADLNSDAAAIWNKILPLLAGTVRDKDGPLLAELCLWWAELERVTAVRDAMVPGAKGYKDVLIASGICADKVTKLAEKFGLSPRDRAKVKPEVPAGPVAAKVPTRPRTKLDSMGPPKG